MSNWDIQYIICEFENVLPLSVLVLSLSTAVNTTYGKGKSINILWVKVIGRTTMKGKVLSLF